MPTPRPTWRWQRPRRKLISEGAQPVGPDSGQTTAIAQVAEQKGILLVINTPPPADYRAGYKFVFRNFPTALMIVATPSNQKEVFEAGEGA